MVFFFCYVSHSKKKQIPFRMGLFVSHSKKKHKYHSEWVRRAIGNVKPMHQCSPKHLHMGTDINRENDITQRNESKWKLKMEYYY